jgi:hypothetical protein
MPKVAPSFSHRFCVDLAGGQVYRQAEKLYESGAVQSAAWEPPYLAGKVKGAAGLYEPRLNLRSTVFVENECRCPVGRKGRICAHAIAMCLHYETNRSEAGVSIEESGSRGGARPQDPAKPNLRRRAEASIQGRWSSDRKDYPDAMPAGDPMSDFPESKIVVDGSTQYLAIRLPAEVMIRFVPYGSCLRPRGFRLEPKNRRWWLRDPHKALNFLANHWNSLREQWRACFTDNFEKRLKGVGMAGCRGRGT